MKKLLTLSFLFFALFFAKADQLAYLTLDQATKAVNYLQKQDHVIMWCACCDDDAQIYVRIAKVYYQRVADTKEPYYEVIIEGTNANGEFVNEAVDLAYVHAQSGSKYKSVGKLLKFKCDPCTKPFEWQGDAMSK